MCLMERGPCMRKKKAPSGKSPTNIVTSLSLKLNNHIVVFLSTTQYTCYFSLFFSPSPEDLSEMLSAGTKEVHEKAENTQFVKDFLRGRIRKELFKVSLKKSLKFKMIE